ncbi:sialic acid-binding Ig-like lectin 11 [Emydura macquarii macquarii]|uniref:sialic acid-binding Ig-like lectin 11 n=1 Tax=Emydura macquarii macquarii TaxID=1129001 RepID=UPI00352B4ACE
MRDLLKDNDLRTGSPADSPTVVAAAEDGQQAWKDSRRLQHEREMAEFHLWEKQKAAEIAERAEERAHQRLMEAARIQIRIQEGKRVCCSHVRIVRFSPSKIWKESVPFTEIMRILKSLSQPDTPAMGRALPPCQDAREQEIVTQGPSNGTGGAAPPAAMLRALLLALLWRGSLAQEPGYSLTVPPSVSVQEGLCVLVPCTFTYPARYDRENPQDKLYGHWFKGSSNVGQDQLVASSEPSRGVSQETRGQFRLVGDPARGDCSLQIDDARQTDAGSYFLRVERGSFKYSYRVSTGYTEPRISVLRLTEKPEIQISPALGLPEMLVAGEMVTVTCTAPGRCSGTPPQISWMGPFSDTARDVSVSLANGTRAHSSELRFTPARGDDGKNLTCTVTYSPAPGPSTSRAFSLQVGYPPGPPNITWTLTRNQHPVLGPVVQGADGAGLCLETQEGDSLTLICEAWSKPMATVNWTKANESLSSGPGGVGLLELSNLSRGDAGEYRCWAKNLYGSASRALRVHVQALEMTLQVTVSRANRSDPQLFPELSTPVVNGSQLTAPEGDSLRFLCSVTSRSPATLAWLRGGRAIKDTISVGENQLQLELPNMTAEDGGLYGCQAQSQESSAQGTFQLLIEYSPRLGIRLNSSCQRQGPRVSCSCSLRSHPLPRLQWQVDGEVWAGNNSWGALQVSSWADGDEAVSTLNWTGSGDSGPRIFCLGSNPYGTYAALHFDLSPPEGVAEEPARLLGLGVACGLGIAVGCFLLGCCVVKLWSRGPASPSAVAKETANGTQGEHPADDAGLIYSNISNLPMDGTTLAARLTKGIQDGAAAAQDPSGPGELAELHYASINFSKVQHKGQQPLQEPAMEYSEIQLK